jgi:phenylacetic acid degradation operon negative regulatory protein
MDGYRISSKGEKRLNEERIWDLTIPTQKTWDRKWRVVLFDIPVDKRKRRDSFRLRIKELGLMLYQNSVWVYPYPIEETLRAIANFYKLGDCVSFITTEKISGEIALQKHFNLYT